MSLAKRILNHTEGFNFLTLPEEKKEVSHIGQAPLRLQYLKKSKQLMGVALWNLLSPQLPEYTQYGNLNGYPTLSLDGLKEKGLIK